MNATETWRDDLAIVARLPGGPEIRTTVPSLVPSSVRKVGFKLQRPRSVGRGNVFARAQTPAKRARRRR